MTLSDSGRFQTSDATLGINCTVDFETQTFSENLIVCSCSLFVIVKVLSQIHSVVTLCSCLLRQCMFVSIKIFCITIQKLLMFESHDPKSLFICSKVKTWYNTSNN